MRVNVHSRAGGVNADSRAGVGVNADKRAGCWVNADSRAGCGGKCRQQGRVWG